MAEANGGEVDDGKAIRLSRRRFIKTVFSPLIPHRVLSLARARKCVRWRPKAGTNSSDLLCELNLKTSVVVLPLKSLLNDLEFFCIKPSSIKSISAKP